MPPDLLANVEAVLFDLDDTLLDYSAARDAAVVAGGERLRLSLGGQALVSLWAALESVHFARYVSGELTVQEQRRARVTGVPGLEGVDDSTADEHFREFLTLSEVLWRPLPGAPEAVLRIRRRMPVAVVTNGAPDIQGRKLARLGLSGVPLFASVATGFPKPLPQAFDGACRALDVPRSRALMVGDNLDVDVYGALAAGLRAVWVDPAGRRGAEGVPTVASVADLA